MVTPAYGSGAMPSVWQPENLQELQTLRRRLKGICCFTAGGTLLRTQWEGGLVPAPEHMISLARIPEMSGISIRGDEIVIGAMTRIDLQRNHDHSGYGDGTSHGLGVSGDGTERHPGHLWQEADLMNGFQVLVRLLYKYGYGS